MTSQLRKDVQVGLRAILLAAVTLMLVGLACGSFAKEEADADQAEGDIEEADSDRAEADTEEDAPGPEQEQEEAGYAGQDLSGQDFSEADLSGEDFSEAILIGAAFTGANLEGANLTAADLAGADLSGANLSGATLTGAMLTEAVMREAILVGANLEGADMTGADLADVDFSGANLTNAVLDDAKLFRVEFDDATLDGASMVTRAAVALDMEVDDAASAEGVRLGADDAARVACDGDAVDGAAEYAAGPGVHPVVFVGDDTSRPDLPDEWTAADESEIQLVACFDYSTVTLQSCTYTGGHSVRLKQETLVLTLVAAQTSDVVASNTFAGPTSCPQSISSSQSQYTASPSKEVILNWLSSYVDP